MTDAAPSVALLFDDGELVEQLRDALHACGARIVHEGGIASLNGMLLEQVDADVLVINLDDAAADALDPLNALIEGERPRIVFNDAEASAALTGWDRARWARHLAVKIFQEGDLDPPRPADSRGVEVPAAEESGSMSVAGDSALANEEYPPVGAVADDLREADHEPGDDNGQHADDEQMPAADEEGVQRSLGETEALSAELEALLASAELLDTAADGDGDKVDMVAPDGAEQGAVDAQLDVGDDSAAAAPAVGLDDLMDILPKDAEQAAARTPVARDNPVPVLPSAPSDWALVDDDAVSPATFGVEKQTAADFLAPDVEMVADDDEPVLNLQLVSMEEAIAPRPAPAAIEMHLDELQMALSHLVLTGATQGGAVGAFAFYAALPDSMRLTFLHTQHLGGQSVDELVEQLAKSCLMKVTLAVDGTSAQPGEVLVVPPGHTVRIRRDAQVEIRASGDELQDPSIDDNLKVAAEVFGRDAMAIVFSGHSTDSIAGAKAINAAGGQVWVEAAAPEYADLVHEIAAARIVDFSGTPEQLAAHLLEKFA